MEALRAGTDALNRLHEQISVDEIAQLMDDTNEAIEVDVPLATLVFLLCFSLFFCLI
jgi:hypothetical protein